MPTDSIPRTPPETRGPNGQHADRPPSVLGGGIGFATRILAATLILALVLPAPHGFTHLHLSLTPMDQGHEKDASPEHVAPSLTADPAELPRDTLGALEGERDGGNATSPIRLIRRGVLRSARTPWRTRVPRRMSAPALWPRRRLGRSSMSRGDPDSDDPSHDAARCDAWREEQRLVVRLASSPPTPQTEARPQSNHRETISQEISPRARFDPLRRGDDCTMRAPSSPASHNTLGSHTQRRL